MTLNPLQADVPYHFVLVEDSLKYIIRDLKQVLETVWDWLNS